jgi:hypothetical protein
MDMQWILFLTFVGIFVFTAVITLLGVTEKLHVKPGYLKALFSTLILELVTAVISLFVGTDFFAEANAVPIEQLPSEYQAATPNEAVQNISSLILENKNNLQKIDAQKTKIESCQNELQENKVKLNKCTIPKSGILGTLLDIQEDIKVHGPTINFLWQSEKKQEAAYRVMNVLGALDFFHEAPTKEPAKAVELLKKYQLSKGISPASGKLGRKTFIQFLNDYIILESNGG